MNISANIWKIYIYKFLSEFYLIAPILIPYYSSKQLSSTQIFTIQAVYALSILIFEIPSGYLADVVGRKKTLIMGAAAFPIGICIYAFTSSFFSFIVAEFILAIANSMRSGCDSAMVYDTLQQTHQESEYKKYEGRSAFYTRIGTSVSSVLGGVAALVSLGLPFYINIATGVLMLPVALTLTEPKRIKLESKHPFRDIIRISRFSLSQKRLRLFLLWAAMIVSTGIVGIWAYFLYYQSLGLSIGYFGVLFAVFQLASAWGSAKAHLIENKLGQKRSLLLLLVIGLDFLLLGLFQSAFLIPLIFLNAFLWGFSYPLFRDYINRLIQSEIRATVLSVANMLGSLSFVILSPLFGKIIDVFSLSFAFLALGLYVFVYGGVAFRVFHQKP